MSSVVTKNNLNVLGKGIDRRIDKAVTDISEIVTSLVHSMHTELVNVRHEQSAMRKSIDNLIRTIVGFVARIDSYETERTARDSQFEKLLVWARKVSKKTGIPLENL